MFQKYPNNPIFGNPALGTLFDVYLTALPDGRFRMDLSTRKDNAACCWRASCASKAAARWM